MLKKPLELSDILASTNVACLIKDVEDLNKIGQRVKRGFEEDEGSMAEWLQNVKQVEELAGLTSKTKNYPLPKSANVKLPIIAKACYEYNSMAYPEIIKDDKVVQAYVIGDDPIGEKRKALESTTKFMNYQLLFEQEDWQLELDRLLFMVALIGFVCKKTYYDPVRKRIRSEIIDPKELIIDSDVKSLDDAARISQIIHLRLNDFVEKANTKYEDQTVFCEEVVDKLKIQYKDSDLNECIDIIEQHCFLDLDCDGYQEPYIVSILKDSGEILRIAPRFNKEGVKKIGGEVQYIDPIKCFVDYHFLVSPKGKFQSIGFGLLLLHLNDSANTVLNELLDAGQLANLRGGYKDARMKIIPSGNSLHNPGEWKDVKSLSAGVLKDGFMPLEYKEPSNVLYQLLGLLIDVSRDLTSSAQINNGTQSSQNAKTGATLSLQQEGKKTTNAINKRIYRSLTNEFRQIFALNGEYLDKTQTVQAVKDVFTVEAKQFDKAKVVMYPIADPTFSSEQKRLQEAAVIQTLIAMPGVDPKKATKFLLAKLNIDDIESILADETTPQPPNPEVIKIQADIQHKADQMKLEAGKLELDQKRAQAELYEIQCRCLELKSKAMLNVAQAEAQEPGAQSEIYLKEMDLLMKQIDAKNTELQNMQQFAAKRSEQEANLQMQREQQMHEQQQQAMQQQHEKSMMEVEPSEGGAEDGAGDESD